MSQGDLTHVHNDSNPVGNHVTDALYQKTVEKRKWYVDRAFPALLLHIRKLLRLVVGIRAMALFYAFRIPLPSILYPGQYLYCCGFIRIEINVCEFQQILGRIGVCWDMEIKQIEMIVDV